MNNPVPEVPIPTLVKGRKRDLLPSRFIAILEFLLPEAAASDDALEQAIAIVETGIRNKSIPLPIGNDLKTHLFAAFRNNDHMLDVMRLLRESGLEVSMLEVDRVRAQRRKVGK